MNTGSLIMSIKTIVSGVAVALALSAGSAFAAEQFATLEGVTVEPMNAVELDTVRGMNLNLTNILGPGGVTAVVDEATAGAPAGGPLFEQTITPPGNPLP